MVQLTLHYQDGLRTEVIHEGNKAVIQTDAPKDNHGKGELFSPTDLLAASLASCVLTYMGIMAGKLHLKLTNLRATVTKEMSKTPPRRMGRIEIHIYSSQTFDPEVTAQLEKAAMGCAVHHSLHPDVRQEIAFHWGQP